MGGNALVVFRRPLPTTNFETFSVGLRTKGARLIDLGRFKVPNLRGLATRTLLPEAARPRAL